MLQGYYGDNKNPTINIDEFLYFLYQECPDLDNTPINQVKSYPKIDTSSYEENVIEPPYDEDEMMKASQELLDNDDIGPTREEALRKIKSIVHEQVRKILKNLLN